MSVKNFFAVLGIVFGLCAQAQTDSQTELRGKFSTDDSYVPAGAAANRLDTLHYQVRQKHLLVQPSFSGAISDTTSGSNHNSTASWFNTNLAMQFGLTDWISFQASQTMESVNSTTSFANNYSASVSQNGMADPKFGFNIRLLGNSDRPQFLNMYVLLSPDMGPRTQDNPFVRGGAAYIAGLNAVFVDGENEIGLNAQATLIGHTTSVSSYSSQYDTYTNPRTTYQWGGELRHHFLGHHYIDGGLQFFPPVTATTIYSSTQAANQSTSALQVVPTLNYGYLYSRDVLLLASYKYQDLSTTVNGFSGSTSSANREQHVLTLGVDTDF